MSVWGSIFPFVLGALSTGAGLLYLFFRWDARPMLEEQIARRRKQQRRPFPVQRNANGWEERLAGSHLRSSPSSSSSSSGGGGGVAESAEWLNSIAQYIFSAVAEKINAAAADGRLESLINSRLAAKKMPDFVCAPVVVSSLSVGHSLPVLQGVEVRRAEASHPLEFSASLSYHGSAFVVVGTSVCAPGVSFISLPVEIALKSLQLDCTARFTVDLAHLPEVRARVTLEPDVQFGVELHTQLGHILVLQDLDVLQAAFTLIVQEILREEIVEPNFKDVTLSLW